MIELYQNKHIQAFRTEEEAQAMGRQLVEAEMATRFSVRFEGVSVIRTTATEVYQPRPEFYVYFA